MLMAQNRTFLQRLTPTDLKLHEALLLITLALITMGLTMVYSSSAVFAANRYHDDTYFVMRQLKFAAIGLSVMAIAANVPVTFIRKNLKWILAAGIFMLLLVLIPGIGKVSGGARRWLPLGFALVQPAELCKILVILFLAHALARRKDGHNPSSMWVAFAFIQVFAVLVVCERDLGTAFVIELIGIVMLFIAGAKVGPMIVAALGLVPVVTALIMFYPYRVARVIAFLDPFAHRRGAGYQLSEALISLGSGGTFGLGLGDGRQKLYFLPEAHTDFIFAIIGEELGFIGTGFVIVLFAALLFVAWQIAKRQTTHFGKFLALGLSSWLVLQAGMNMCVATGLMPTKGLTLPFISYGGSSLISCCAAIGLLYSLATKRDDEATA